MNVNWRWHARFRGLLPLSPHAMADDGSLLVVRPDELEARRYQILRVDGRGTATVAQSVSVETVRQIWLTADAPMVIGQTDDDLYLFRDGRKSRFLSERRVTYLAVALARGGAFFATGFTDMLFAGQTLALVDAGGKVLWTKDLDAPITAVATAASGGAEGRVVVAGLENGRVVAFDAARSLLWEVALDAVPVALSLITEGARCIVVTAGGTVTAVDRGDVAWRTELPAAGEWTPGSVAAACDGNGSVIALAGGGETDGWVVLLDREGRSRWEQTTGARVTGAALSPSGAQLALSHSNGELLQFEIEPGDPACLSGNLAPDAVLRRAQDARTAGREEEARQLLLQLLAASPGHLPACEALIGLDKATRDRALGEARRLTGEARFSEALAALEAARVVAPTDEELPRCWAETLSAAEAYAAEQAADAEKLGDLERASAAWGSLLQLDPRRVRGREEIARLNGQLAEQLTGAGEAALAAGREEEALAAWRRAQSSAPSEALADRLREVELQRCLRAGVALYGQQRFAEAAFQLRKVLAIQPDHAEALRYLAYIDSSGPQSLLSERFSRLE